MMIHLQVTIETSEEEVNNVSEGVSEILSNVVNREQFLGAETRVLSVDLIQSLGSNGISNKVCAIDSSDLTPSFLDRLSFDTKTMFFIRIPVEGTESNTQRFDLMDDLLRKIGGNPNRTVENVIFVFDTGWSNTFLKRATEFVFSRDPHVISSVREERITYVMWIDRASRDNLLAPFKDPPSGKK